MAKISEADDDIREAFKQVKAKNGHPNYLDEENWEEVAEILQEKGYDDVFVFTCPCCNEPTSIRVDDIDFDENANEVDLGHANDQEICGDCEERLMGGENDAHVVIFLNGTKYEGYTLNNFYFIEDEYDVPSEIEQYIKDIAENRKYHRIDGWRGYSVFEPKTLEHFDDGTILSMHQSEEMEKQRYDLLKEALEELEIPLIAVFSHTSNIFCNNVDYFVPKEHSEKATKVSKCINSITKIDDPRWNIGILFSDLQDSPPTKQIVKEMNESVQKNRKKYEDHLEKLKNEGE